MGRLENGKWIVEDLIPKSKSGEFERPEQKFRNTIAPQDAVKDRYHLYVSNACPWAHRTLIMRHLKNLESIIPVTIVSPYMLEDGWSFDQAEPVFGKNFLREIYVEADPEFTGRVTVPVLFDTKNKTIVNNESAEVIRIMNSAFNHLTDNHEDYYPEELRAEIDKINEDVYENINNGVYKAGFAQEQKAYDRAVRNLFDALDRIEDHLEGKTYLVGGRLTEADIRLYTTLVRFDPVYYGHFKCNRNMIREYKNLADYLGRLFSIEAFSTTTNFEHIKNHYYVSQKQINPSQIVPMGPIPLVVQEATVIKELPEAPDFIEEERGAL